MAVVNRDTQFVATTLDNFNVLSKNRGAEKSNDFVLTAKSIEEATEIAKYFKNWHSLDLEVLSGSISIGQDEVFGVKIEKADYDKLCSDSKLPGTFVSQAVSAQIYKQLSSRR